MSDIKTAYIYVPFSRLRHQAAVEDVIPHHLDFPHRDDAPFSLLSSPRLEYRTIQSNQPQNENTESARLNNQPPDSSILENKEAQGTPFSEPQGEADMLSVGVSTRRPERLDGCWKFSSSPVMRRLRSTGQGDAPLWKKSSITATKRL